MSAHAAVAQPASRSSPRRSGSGDSLRIAAIGVGSQGRFNMRVFLEDPGVVFPVICDVDQEHAWRANKEILDGEAEVVEDYRRILDRKDIHAILICTPEHWHAIQMIQACQAGKDVYVEKPMCHNVAEGRRMVNAARKHNCIVQVGIQQQSGPFYAEAAAVVREEKIGKVTHVRMWNTANMGQGFGFPAEGDPPRTLNWDLWLGPAPMRPYNPVLASGLHRLFWAIAGGTMTDWGTHHIGSVHHIMGADKPLSAMATGGKFFIKDITETPDTMNAMWEYPGWTLEYSQRHTGNYAAEGNSYGIMFFGTTGTLYIDRGGYEIYPESDPHKPITVGKPRLNSLMPEPLSRAHIRNFLGCVRSRRQPNAPPEIGQQATAVAHLANIALHVGRKVCWNAEREIIVDDSEASRLLGREYRAPYLLPEA